MKIGIKLDRAANNLVLHRDSITDVAGYARTIELVAEDEAAKNEAVSDALAGGEVVDDRGLLREDEVTHEASNRWGEKLLLHL